MPIINHFPGGSGLDVDVSETTLTPENARTGYSFFNASEKFVSGEMPDYTGETVVTPSTVEQVLATAGTYMAADLTVEAIPSGYTRSQVGTAHLDSVSTFMHALFPITFEFDEDLSFSAIEEIYIECFWAGNEVDSGGVGTGQIISRMWSSYGSSDFNYISVKRTAGNATCSYQFYFTAGTKISVSGKYLTLDLPTSITSDYYFLPGDYVCLVIYPR